MRIEAYFQKAKEVIETCPIVQSSDVRYDKRGTHEGFIRGELYFLDGSILHLREYVDVENKIDRLAYAYQYLSSEKQLIFRYDNSGHHKKLNLPTYPNHKHDGSESNVIASPSPDLKTILEEIETLVDLPS